MIVLDLEWNRGYDKTPLDEILQIGAVRLDRPGGRIVDTFNVFIKPHVHKRLNRTAKALPEIAGKIAEPLSQIDKITIIGGGSDGENGVGSVAGNVPVVMAKLFESMKEATGVDLAEIMKADTYDAKVTRNVNLTGAPDVIVNAGAVPEA